ILYVNVLPLWRMRRCRRPVSEVLASCGRDGARARSSWSRAPRVGGFHAFAHFAPGLAADTWGPACLLAARGPPLQDQLFPALERLPGGVRARARSPPAVLTDAACAGRSRVCGVESSWCALVEHRGSVGGPGPSPSVVFLGLPSLDGRTVASRRSMPTDGVLPNCIGLLAVQPTRRKGHGVLRRMRQAPEKD
ncbi:unnamed protein product, partial [Prorocentrum cordatum]